jgi:HAD superfamily hydrolase (TIGR01509 family)
MAIEAVVFDFDGVIVETEEPSYLAWRQVWAGYGQDLCLEEWAGCIGTSQRDDTFHPFEELVRRTGLNLREADVRAQKQHLATTRFAGTPLSAGVVDWLDEAALAGMAVGIASSSPRTWILEHLDRVGLSSRFQVIACFDDCGVSKPDPASYLLACRSLRVPPERALAVEDSVHGIRAAKQAGMSCVAVPTPMTAHMDFGAADLIVGSLADTSLPAVLQTLSARDCDHTDPAADGGPTRGA